MVTVPVEKEIFKKGLDMKYLHSEKLMALWQPQQTVNVSNFGKHGSQIAIGTFVTL
jgi:hypothetical protein